MEFGENDMPCVCASNKVCSNCVSSTREDTTGKLYCCDVSWIYMALFGPRRVRADHTCSRWAVKQIKQKVR